MTSHVPPEEPPPEVAEHLRHMTDGRWHDRCRFCLRRREKGGTGVLPEDYLPPVSISDLQDVMVGFRRLLSPPRPIEASVSQIEGEAWDDDERMLPPGYMDRIRAREIHVYDGRFECDPGTGRHCDHWKYTADPCCKCRDDGDRLGGATTCTS